MIKNLWAKCCHHNKHLGIFILRLAVGIIMLMHGIGKLSDMNGTIAFFTHLGMGAFTAWLVTFVETVGGAALILGLFTQAAAIAIAIEMLVIILWMNWGKPFERYNLEFLILASTLALALMGAGKHSLASKCGSCKGCDCPCHPADARCGADGKCKSCGCE